MYLIHSAKANRPESGEARKQPALRKATEQMLWAYACANECFTQALAGKIDSAEIGLVVGSGQGEQETTKEYYKFLVCENRARPFLFQNSLHHSTAGMLCQSIGLTGPSISVSDTDFSGEAALDMAGSLLETGQCLACIVVGVDTLVPDFAAILRTIDGSAEERGEGAAALVVANATGLQKLGGKFRFQLSGLRFPQAVTAGEANHQPLRENPYEADFLQRIHETTGSGLLTARKRHGGSSSISLASGGAL